MIEKVYIHGLDHFGRGIAYIDGKVVFVESTLPNELVDIKIIEEKKKYSVAKVIKHHAFSEERIDSICPYFKECGGCSFLCVSYKKSLEYKKNKVKELLIKNKIKYQKEIEIIESKKTTYYRNKISLKIVDGKVGYFKAKTHDLVEINNCIIANDSMNKIIQNIHLLGVKNGILVVRVNYNEEVLLIIESEEKKYHIELGKLKKLVKLVGIVYSGYTLYGNNFFYERIGGYLFKVSYDSFFQVNSLVCEKIFKLLELEIDDNAKVLDLYSGVGTLGIVASKKAKNVVSVEIVKNAVLNGILNAKLNKRENIKFILGDTSRIVSKVKKDFDTLIVDPPRVGLDKKVLSFIKETKPKKIIYISCDVNTFIRDLKVLENNYEIKDYKLLDMFPYSYHIEGLCVLESSKSL